MRNRARWGRTDNEWSSPADSFRFRPADRKRLNSLVAPPTAATLEDAACQYVVLLRFEENETPDGDVRAALEKLKAWATAGSQMLNSIDATTYERICDTKLDAQGTVGDLTRDVRRSESLFASALHNLRPARGNRRKLAQRKLAGDVAGILSTAGYPVTTTRGTAATRPSLYNEVLKLILGAAGESKSTHKLAAEGRRSIPRKRGK